MDLIVEELKKFRDLKTNKEQLLKCIQSKENISIFFEVIVVKNIHLIKLLRTYSKRKIDLEYLINWVNFVWFSDYYYYHEEHENCIASIMSKLEELDEDGKYLNEEEIQKYIVALENNREL